MLFMSYTVLKRELNFGKYRRKKVPYQMGKNNIIDSTIKNNNKENNTNPEKVFDIAIIGGGFAGLSAALLLGRYIRPTVIFDSGNTRNSVTRQVHGYLGFENICPTQLLKKAWKDVNQYRSIQVIQEKIEFISKDKD